MITLQSISVSLFFFYLSLSLSRTSSYFLLLLFNIYNHFHRPTSNFCTLKTELGNIIYYTRVIRSFFCVYVSFSLCLFPPLFDLLLSTFEQQQKKEKQFFSRMCINLSVPPECSAKKECVSLYFFSSKTKEPEITFMNVQRMWVCVWTRARRKTSAGKKKKTAASLIAFYFTSLFIFKTFQNHFSCTKNVFS